MNINKLKKVPIRGKKFLTAQNPNIYRAVLFTLLIIAISIQGGNDFSFILDNQSSPKQQIKIKHVKRVFPEADSYIKSSNKPYAVLSENADTLGFVVPTFAFAKGVKGFAGEVPVLIGLNKNMIVEGMTLLKNHESQEYMEYIVDNRLLYKWNGKSIPEALEMKVDAITAATETSQAIVEGVKMTFAGLSNSKLETGGINYKEVLQIVLTVATMVFALLVCFNRKMKAYRNYMLIMVALVMGFMYKTMLSVALLHGWVVNGMPWETSTLIVILLFMCIILPFTTKKQFYCHYMCPYGAVQELAGKLSPIKKKKNMNWLKVKGVKLQTILFALLLVLLLSGLHPELSFIEPFPSFSFEIVSWGMIAFGAGFIGLSFFYSKPWCKICPTGFIFDSCKKQNNSNQKDSTFNMKNSEILNLLLVVVIIILLLKVGNTTKENDANENDLTHSKPAINTTTRKHEKKSIGERPTMFPMPALVIGSYGPEGQPNIMTAAWGGIVNSRPLSISVSLRKATQTYKNVMQTQAFTINYASAEHTPFVDWIGEHSGKSVNKFEVLGLTPVKSALVNAPYVKEFPVVVELKVVKTQDLGSHTQFIGEVVDTKVDKSVLADPEEDEEESFDIDIRKMNPILIGTWNGYYGFGEWIGTPGKIHSRLGIEIEGTDEDEEDDIYDDEENENDENDDEE